MASKKIKSIIISITMCMSLILPSTVFASNNINVERLAGQDRYETNSKIVDKGWVMTKNIILCNSTMYADAIISAPLSKKLTAPILLTDGNILSQTAADKIKSLDAKNIYIIGGTGVISSDIESNLKSQGYNVVRVAGQTRYDTSVAVAKQLGGNNGVFVVDGDNWKDAISIAPVAAELQSPILLANKDNVIDSVKEYPTIGARPITVIGDNDFVKSRGILDSYGVFTTVSGVNSIDINEEIIEKYKDKLDFGRIILATDTTFADALSGSALAALNDNPIVLMNNDNKSSISNILVKNKNNVNNIQVLGGSQSINDDEISDIFAAVDESTKPKETNNNGNTSQGNTNTNSSGDGSVNSGQQINSDVVKVNDSQIDLSQYNDYLRDYKNKIKALIQTVKPLKIAITTGDDKDYIIIHLFFNGYLDKYNYFAKPDVGFTFYKNGNMGISIVQPESIATETYNLIFQSINQYLPNEMYYLEFLGNSTNALETFSNLSQNYKDTIHSAVLYKENKIIYNQTFLKTYGSYNIHLEIVNGVEYEIFNEIFPNLN